MSKFKIIKKIIKKFKKPGYEKYDPKSTNIGLNKVKKEKLYTTEGKDKHGDINIINKGPLTGERLPLDKPKYKDRRPWSEYFSNLPKWFTNLWILVVASVFGIKGTQIFRNGGKK